MSSILDNTSGCPVADRCANHHTLPDGAVLEVVVVSVPVGELCLTLCGDCIDDDRLPKLSSWSAAVDAVWAHCAHLGISPDRMAALIEQETAEEDDE